MAQERAPKLELPPVEQIGIVVKNVEETMEFFSSVFGWGPWSVLELDMKDCLYRGASCDARLKLAFAQSGSVELELIQVLEGETIHTEFLREKGEGLHHLRFKVDDLDAKLADLAKEGVDVVFRKNLNGVDFAYLNTDRFGGIMLELIEY
jgi:catechol 2,3-dioxygenase-like lactoylglutathione lyase family enzyme